MKDSESVDRLAVNVAAVVNEPTHTLRRKDTY